MADDEDVTVVNAALLDELVATLDEPDVAPMLALLAQAPSRYRQMRDETGG